MKLFLSMLMFLFVAAGLNADLYSDFRALVDLNASIKSLASQPEQIRKDKIYLLEGTIASLQVVDKDPQRFYAEAVFISAEWKDKKQLFGYKVSLIFNRNEFSSRIFNRPQGAQDEIVSNSRGLALVKYEETITLPDGSRSPVFSVYDFKLLK